MGYLAHAIVLCFCWTFVICPFRSTPLPSPRALSLRKAHPYELHQWTPTPSSFQTGSANGCAGRRLGGGVRGKSGIYAVFILAAPSLPGSHWLDASSTKAHGFCPQPSPGSGKHFLPLPLQPRVVRSSQGF